MGAWTLVQTCRGKLVAAEILDENGLVMVTGASMAVRRTVDRLHGRYKTRRDAEAAADRVAAVKRRYAPHIAFSAALVTSVEREQAKAIREALAA